ncbi:MAG TPA: L-threonylcarbamoyladenylate synthase [Arachidicoccus sp.]|nr:L-threonylcarbamoyladenylate synthase [Arachidicoccus sp.]
MQKEFENDLESSLFWLRGEGILLYPTDTVWGLGCDATNEIAIQRIIELKRRPQNKSFVILVANEEQLQLYVNKMDDALSAYLAEVRKPTTVIYPNAGGLAPSALATDGSVAIRICRDPFCQQLLLKSGKPLLSTSANLSGQTAPALFKEIDPIIRCGVDFVVRYRQKDNNRSEPSTIVKWHPEKLGIKQNPIEIIRL